MSIFCDSYPALAKQETLFIHGNLASTKWWAPTLTAWKKSGSQGSASLHFADWRGCGQNPPWPADQPFTLTDLARDFLQLMDQKELKKVSLVGHSLGGLIALQIMCLQPERIERAVLLDPVSARGVVFDDGMYEAFRQMAASRELTRTVILSTIHHSENLNEGDKEAYTDDAFKAVKGIGSSVLEILKSVDLSEDAARVRVPTLILHGEKDAVLPIADSEKLAALLPKSQFERLVNAGHCWNVEDPEAFTKRVRSFL